MTHSKFLSYLFTKCGEDLIHFDNCCIIEKNLDELCELLNEKIIFKLKIIKLFGKNLI